MPASASLSAVLAGFGLGASLIVAIGAQNLFVLRQGLARRHVLPVVCFCAGADILLMAAGIAGIGAVLRALPGLVAVLTAGGGLFLLVYGARALRRAARTDALVARDAGPDRGLARTLAQAAAFTLLNPHVYLDTVLLIGSVAAARAPGHGGSFLLGSGTASMVWFALLGFGARLLAPLFARPRAWQVLDAIIGVVMLALSASLWWRLLEGRG
ncbi:LysE/ArgO family amino acid transporter [Rhizosaccharibacter radicis]|uniref:LysE/ArgO family amino acid transporter n=1 Tax=Rhizosaccharibacter radicis TaxID=2782605 RepID=A0ABT1W180_9PROT|nr:LysE/ArgO family amino acid transporter [Acetobacteraceae bacterium KSS12]